MVAYFWDSYAIIELINGNSNYARYSQEPITLTIFNLTEIYWFAINGYSEEEAKSIYFKLRGLIVEVSDKIIMKAIEFRKEHKKGKLSYTDCIGYIYAVKNNLKFLTGDKEFEDLPNVEFVK